MFRQRFSFNVEISSDITERAIWREISWGDAPALHRFFADALAAKQKELMKEDKIDAKQLSTERQKGYEQEARKIIFSLRALPDIDRLLCTASKVGLPNVLRVLQSGKDLKDGAFGGLGGALIKTMGVKHIAVLWKDVGKEILGIGTLDKTDRTNEAEIAGWLHPKADRLLGKEAFLKLMAWGHEVVGYQHYIMKIEAKDRGQRGNRIARIAAQYLNFRRTQTERRPNGGKTVWVMERDWSPN